MKSAKRREQLLSGAKDPKSNKKEEKPDVKPT